MPVLSFGFSYTYDTNFAAKKMKVMEQRKKLWLLRLEESLVVLVLYMTLGKINKKPDFFYLDDSRYSHASSKCLCLRGYDISFNTAAKAGENVLRD